MGILRLIAVILGMGTLALVVLVAGITFMPGTKIGHVFGATPEALAGHTPQHGTLKQWNDALAAAEASSADAGTAADAGTVAATPAGQKPSAPTEAQALPEQQGR